jgi:hypothetical protein
MSSFEFLFSLFGLLLGFTLVEVLGGLVRTTKIKRTRGGGSVAGVRLGWLSPLLAMFVILDIASYWANIWSFREYVPVGFDTIFGGLLIAGGYYFAASMVFPEDAQAWPDLDEWFWLHRRQVLGPLFFIAAAWASIYLSLAPTRGIGELLVIQLIYFGLMGVAFFARKPTVVACALAASSLFYLFFGVREFIARFN